MIAPAKSTATLFTTFSNELGKPLPIEVGGAQVPTVRHPKFLGVTFDGLLNFGEHARQLRTRMQARNNVLKALAGQAWGLTTELMTATYKTIERSLASYCAPTWTPNLSATNWQMLQTQQNAALRTALGCVKMTPVDHLHAETRMMKLPAHNEMLSRQFLLTTQRKGHPNRQDLRGPPPGRVMRETLATLYGQDYAEDLPEEGLDHDHWRSWIREIHTAEVSRSLAELEPNPVLGEEAPQVSTTERQLPPRTRSLLSQLRSGKSPMLNTFMARIRPGHTDRCPDCGIEPHDTSHLFNCTARPTHLTPRSLWEAPEEAAEFLGLERNLEDPG